MAMLEVRLEGGLWVVVGDQGDLVSRHDTQQRAIEAAKVYARRTRSDVLWRDRQGNHQGKVTYRLFARSDRMSWWHRLLSPKGQNGDWPRGIDS